ncbi:Nitrate reductase [compost metagenome]
MASTDTARHADVLLPSLGWGEKDGTVTNSERRISRQRGFLDAPGEAKADWWQMAEVGRRMGFDAAFAFGQASEIFAEHAALSGFENAGSRDFDISGVERDSYDAMTPFQWPKAESGDATVTRFFADGRFYHGDGKARFIATALPEIRRTSPDYPLTLNTGRIRDQWHTMTRTGKSARLTAHIAEPFAELHPRDAQALGIESADLVELESPHGKVLLRALVSERQARGSVFVPMHWNDQFASRARIDMVVAPVTDPHSGQPASKNVAVKARRFAAKAYGFAISRTRPDAPDCAYWAIAKADGGYRMELAFAEEPQDWTLWARQVFGIDARIEPLGYSDRQTGDLRLAFFDGETLLAALFIANEPVAVARNWAISQLTERHEDLRMRFALVAGRPGAGRADPGATVCSCFNVGVNQITAAIRDGCHSVEAIGKALNAGTNCGSCRAEIRGIIDGCLKTAAE